MYNNNNNNKNLEAHQPPRPLDAVLAAGPPATPPPFDRPRIHRGMRGTLRVYDDTTNKFSWAQKCLFGYNPWSEDPRDCPEAYWPIPGKPPLQSTIFGCVGVCWVLERDATLPGVVFRRTSRKVAVKVSFGSRMETLRHTENPVAELSCLQLVGNHPHVMGALDALRVDGDFHVVLPFAKSGDLCEVLGTGRPMGEKRARSLFKQVVAGVRHLHDCGVCHRDLSPENVLMDEHNCLVIDMGMALRVPYSSHYGTVASVQRGGVHRRLIEPQNPAGKRPYMSPEIYRGKAFDGEAIDVWSLGTILFMMVTGQQSYELPHPSDPLFQWMTRNMAGLLDGWRIRDQWQTPVSESCADLLASMLSVDPRRRATLDEVWDHPWMSQC